ncbi:MAG: hypothetical protein HC796_09515 [Synechococcaceae cyanobacterium RL_1_2]|nr:hypothetical protein [Synechococcaceae cyanobacterium RL_1_2]
MERERGSRDLTGLKLFVHVFRNLLDQGLQPWNIHQIMTVKPVAYGG